MNEEKINELEEIKLKLKAKGFELRYEADLYQQKIIKLQENYTQIVNQIGSTEIELIELRKEKKEK